MVLNNGWVFFFNLLKQMKFHLKINLPIFRKRLNAKLCRFHFNFIADGKFSTK